MFRLLKQVIKVFMPYGLLCLYRNRGCVNRRLKYRGYKTIGYGEGMGQFVDWLRMMTMIEVKNIFEIGANFAQDAGYLAYRFNVPPQNVYVFEAHPELYKAITKLHKFNAYNYAVFNEEKDILFNMVSMNSANSGRSSIFEFDSLNKIISQKTPIKAIRMDNFMNANNISKIDFLKLDVEGATYEVLEGFGERLKDIQAMHIETEHDKWYSGTTRYFEDTARLLNNNGFEMVYLQKINIIQSDSFWIKKEMMQSKTTIGRCNDCTR